MRYVQHWLLAYLWGSDRRALQEGVGHVWIGLWLFVRILSRGNVLVDFVGRRIVGPIRGRLVLYILRLVTIF